MQIDFRSEPRELFRLYRELIKAASPKLPIGRLILPWSFLVICGLLIGLMIIRRPVSDSESVCLFIGLVLVLAAIVIPPFTGYYRVWRLTMEPSAGEPQSVEVTPEFLICKSANAVGAFHWRFVTKLLTTPGYFFLCLRDSKFIPVPLVVFTSPANATDFSTIVHSAINGANPQTDDTNPAALSEGVWPPAPGQTTPLSESSSDCQTPFTRSMLTTPVSSQSVVTYRFLPNSEDYRHFKSKYPIASSLPTALNGLFILATFVLFAEIALKPVSLPSLLIAELVSSVIFLVLFGRLTKQRISLAYPESSPWYFERTITTDFVRLVVSDRIASWNYKCSGLKSVHRSKQGVYIKMPNGTGEMLPSRCFPSEADADSFYRRMSEAIDGKVNNG